MRKQEQINWIWKKYLVNKMHSVFCIFNKKSYLLIFVTLPNKVTYNQISEVDYLSIQSISISLHQPVMIPLPLRPNRSEGKFVKSKFPFCSGACFFFMATDYGCKTLHQFVSHLSEPPHISMSAAPTRSPSLFFRGDASAKCVPHGCILYI